MEQTDPFFIENEDLKTAIQVLNCEHELQVEFKIALKKSDETIGKLRKISESLVRLVNSMIIDYRKVMMFCDQHKALLQELSMLDDQLKHLISLAALSGYPNMLNRLYFDSLTKSQWDDH